MDDIVDAEYEIQGQALVPIEELDPQEPLPEDHPEYDYVPETDAGKRPPGKYCMSRKSHPTDGKSFYCRNPAGKRTDHLGVGRCWLHGGLSVVKSGYYSNLKRYNTIEGPIGELYEKYAEEDKDPLDIAPELHMMRALMEDFIRDYHRHKEALYAWRAAYALHANVDPPKITIPNIHSAYKMIDSLSKAVDRERRRHEATAIDLKTLFRLMARLGEVVKDAVLDETMSPTEKLKYINKEWSRTIPK